MRARAAQDAALPDDEPEQIAGLRAEGDVDAEITRPAS
jgi:hypothetical protein